MGITEDDCTPPVKAAQETVVYEDMEEGTKKKLHPPASAPPATAAVANVLSLKTLPTRGCPSH